MFRHSQKEQTVNTFDNFVLKICSGVKICSVNLDHETTFLTLAPRDESGRRGMDQAPWDVPGIHGTDQGPKGWIRAHWDRSGPQGTNQGPGRGIGTSRVR